MLKHLLLFLCNRLLPLILLIPAVATINAVFKNFFKLVSSAPLVIVLVFPAVLFIRITLDRFFTRKKIHNPLALADTLEHEFTHAFWGLLFLNPPGKVQAASDGNGFVEFRGSNRLIWLSPYFFPLWATLVLPLYLISNSEYLFPIRVIHTLLLANYFLRLSRELRIWQPDIKQSGLLSSVLWIFALLPLFATFHFWIVMNQHPIHFFETIWQESLLLLEKVALLAG